MHKDIGPTKFQLESPDCQLWSAAIARALADIRFYLSKWDRELPNFITYYNKEYCIEHGLTPKKNKKSLMHNEIHFLTAYYYLFRMEEDPLYDILKQLELITDFNLDHNLLYEKIREEAISSLKRNQVVYDFLKFKYKNLP